MPTNQINGKPMVILFGPSSAGKTAILGRLLSFIDTNITDDIGNTAKFGITDTISGSKDDLREVLKAFSGKPPIEIRATESSTYAEIYTKDFTILEVAGEALIDKGKLKIGEGPVSVVFNSTRPKVWVIILDPDIENKTEYTGIIRQLASSHDGYRYINFHRDKVIFLISKIDKVYAKYRVEHGGTNYELGNKIYMKSWVNETFRDTSHGLLEDYDDNAFIRRSNIFEYLFNGRYTPLYDIVEFCTGSWKGEKEDETKIDSPITIYKCDYSQIGTVPFVYDFYPKQLLNLIHKFIYGR